MVFYPIYSAEMYFTFYGFFLAITNTASFSFLTFFLAISILRANRKQESLLYLQTSFHKHYIYTPIFTWEWLLSVPRSLHRSFIQNSDHIIKNLLYSSTYLVEKVSSFMLYWKKKSGFVDKFLRIAIKGEFSNGSLAIQSKILSFWICL